MRFHNFYYFLYFTLGFSFVATSQLENGYNVVKEKGKSFLIPKLNDTGINMDEINKVRVKRQSGAGKYTEAAKMPQVKQLRLFLQLFKNFWDSAYVGGSHPLHPNVPKTTLTLYRQKIVEFFIPDVGANPDKEVS